MTSRGDKEVAEGTLLWSPEQLAARQTTLSRYQHWLESQYGKTFEDYAELWRWSVDSLEEFWSSIAEFFQVEWVSPCESVLDTEMMPGCHWFQGAELNYAAHALRGPSEAVALLACNETGAQTQLTYGELEEQVARARSGLVRCGVRVGDRVVGWIGNTPESVVLFLATASLGAVWSSCSPEFGVSSVVDRFQQIEPKVLIATTGYRYGGKRFELTDGVGAVLESLKTVEHVVLIGGGEGEREATVAFEHMTYAEFLANWAPLSFQAVPFEHPLWILYSSGTTGLPKAIVQGHGGILLEHLKALGLHCDIQSSDRMFWFTTTGWMMWNFLVGALLVRATVVLYDGSPGFPDLSALWRLAESTRTTYLGVSAPYLVACQKAALVPKEIADLGRVRAIGTTGAPLPAAGFAWVYENVAQDLLLGSISGGTDVCTAFVLSCPQLPVHAGEIQCAGLGAAVQAWSDQGQPLYDEVGELVLTQPMPSMPLFFWGDTDGSRYRDSYFSMYPGVWRHGDWVKVTARGGYVIYGRSDSTLNRGGVRMGTSEFYRIVESLSEVQDSLVVDTASLEDPAGKLWLFLVLRPEVSLDSELLQRVRKTLRTRISPRHVPDEIRQVKGIPRTLSGKKLEVPIKRILGGTPVEVAVNRGTLSNPETLDAFIALRAP